MNLDEFTDYHQWAQEQWADVELGDSRRTDRAVEVGAAIAANPAASLPEQMLGWNALRASYRLFSEPDVTHAALIEPHTRATACIAQNLLSGVVLFIQDTTELDYSAHKQVEGLGEIGDGRGSGIMLHSCIAVEPTPANPNILGLAGQIPWMRGVH